MANRTYIGDEMSRLEVDNRLQQHNISMNELRPATSNSSINFISGEKKDKENLFMASNSARSSSTSKKPVNFMN